jgi:hypothetical protein
MAEVGARFDHVGLAVADLAAEASWFCEVFGLVPELALRVEPLDLSIEMLIHPEYGWSCCTGLGRWRAASRTRRLRPRCATGTGT